MDAAIDVFEYLDYRSLLSDFYRAKKDQGRGFSYRSFSRRAGFTSPNHLKRVMDGDRNLTDESSTQYAKAMGLSGEPAAYFTELVRFNQSKTNAARETSYERMRGFRGYRRAQQLDDKHVEYHSHWYIPVVREMALLKNFRADPRWIAGRLVPAISTDEAARALQVLFDLGMLTKAKGGSAVQTEPVVTTGPQTRGMHMRRYHDAMLTRAKESMDVVDKDDRYLSSLTFTVGAEGFERIKRRVLRFRQELIAMLTEEEDGEAVLQLGIQLFPVTSTERSMATSGKKGSK